MNTASTLAVAALALASIPLLAQQTPSTDQAPGGQQPSASAPSASAESTPPTSAASATLSSVSGELVDKLDTKTAKTGDPVVIRTQSNVTTANGTEIPKGSKLVGKVTGVKPIGQGSTNSQVALQFDHAELKSGQSVPIHAEIQEISTSGSTSGSDTPSTMAAAPSTPASGAPGGMSGSSAAATGSAAAQPQAATGSGSATARSAEPAPGTVVARTGNIAIRTTSIPGVLLACNEPGQQDPRMAQSSGILLGPKHDIQLEGGTRVVVGVSVAGAGHPGGD